MTPTRLICDLCGLRVWRSLDPDAHCDECGGPLRLMGRLEGMVDRWFAPPEQVASRMHRRHMQLLEEIWAADGRSRELYELLRPKGVSFDKFIDRSLELLTRGLEDGWIRADLPSAPVPDDSAYAITISDPDRFAAELEAAFPAPTQQPRNRALS